jgi:hypothetical protein
MQLLQERLILCSSNKSGTVFIYEDIQEPAKETQQNKTKQNKTNKISAQETSGVRTG